MGVKLEVMQAAAALHMISSQHIIFIYAFITTCYLNYYKKNIRLGLVRWKGREEKRREERRVREVKGKIKYFFYVCLDE